MSQAEPRVTTLAVADTQVHVRMSGPADGPQVLLLHGGRFHSGTWEELGTLAWLSQEGFRAIAVDLPGYGETASSELERGAFLAALLDALELDNAVLVTPSMSGCFALPYLLEQDHARVAGWFPIAPACLDAHWDELASISLATFVLWGDEDRVFPVAEADRVVAALPNADKAILEGAAHPCYLDLPDEFHGLLAAFTRRLAAR